MTLTMLLPILAAFLIALLFVPVMRSIAVRLGLVDRPDAERKLHAKPIAVSGGIAVFLATLSAFSAALWWLEPDVGSNLLWGIPKRWIVFFGSAAAIMTVGLVDDIWTLRGRQKLFFQLFIVLVVAGTGAVSQRVDLFGFELPLRSLGLPLSVLYLLVCVNALNLIDGADGMATTVGAIVCASLGIMIVLGHGLTAEAIAALCLCGALMGFLVFNRPPASIFLGDAGSMMVGLMVGILSMWCTLKESTVISAGPIAILVLPLFDSSAAIARRWMTGRSLYTTDRGHLHHVLHERFGDRGMLWVVAALCGTSSFVALAAVRFGQEWLAPAGAILVLFGLIVTRSFGYSECRLFAGKAYHFIRSFLTRAKNCEQEVLTQSLKTQGKGCWDVVWEPLVEFAKANDLSSVRMDANLAWLHEGYHATWQNVRLPEKALQSRVRVPLFARRPGEDEHVPIGHVDVIAAGNEQMHERMSDFLIHASELQTQVEELVERIDAEFRGRRPIEPTKIDLNEQTESVANTTRESELVAGSG
ncbi:MAG: MraY family glycosyltransferase [Planctomycetota bacterium]